MSVNISPTLAISALLKDKKNKGESVFDLGVGEIVGLSNLDLIKFLSEQMKSQAIWQYPQINGLKELREIVCNWYNKDYDTHYSPDNILVTCGAKFGIFILLQTLLNEGDEVIIQKPYWVSYPEIVKIFKGNSIFVESKEEKEWKITVDDLERKYSKNTKILILNNVGNPTGVFYQKTELQEILNWAYSKNIIVISDEVYSNLVYDNNNFISCASLGINSNLIVVQSCSKNFAMSGWRVGFILADTKIINDLMGLQSQSITGVPVIAQYGALYAIENRKEIQKIILKEVEERKNTLIRCLEDFCDLRDIRIVSGLYAFISLSDLGIIDKTSEQFVYELIDKYNTAVVPGKAFGEDSYVRISFGATEKDIEEGIKRIGNFIKKIN